MAKKRKKIAVAMSGGVDSGAAAAFLVGAGHQCAGFHMKLWQEVMKGKKAAKHLRGGRGVDLLAGERNRQDHFVNKCCDLESLEAARKTAHQLGMPFYVVDFEKVFKKKVVDYFLQAYASGLTPNPCVMCNKFIKFGELLEYVRGLGYDYLATGHYSRVVRGETQNAKRDTRYKMRKTFHCSRLTYHLFSAQDQSKDQSYFLYNLTQKQLAHVFFPVGDYLKKEVVAMAKKWELPVAKRPESQEICFFPESDYRPFLRRQIPGKIVPGEAVDVKGRVIGKHKGLPLYTIGQRKGLGRLKHLRGGRMPSSDGEIVIPPFYVIAKDAKKNQLVVGFGKETEKKEFWVKDVSWVSQYSVFSIQRPAIECFVRLRHQGELMKCKVKRETPACRRGRQNVKRKKVSCIAYHVSLSEPKRGIAPGQAAVFYQKSRIKNQKVKTQTKNLKRNRLKSQLITNHFSLITDFEVLGGGIIS